MSDDSTDIIPHLDVPTPRGLSGGVVGGPDTEATFIQRSPGVAPMGPPTPARYTLGQVLGRGGMGTVYQAHDQRLERTVAMKTLLDEDEDLERRFVLEAQVNGQLDHPNVLPVYDLDRDPLGRPFLTMKQVREHTSLDALIETLRSGRDLAQRAEWTFQRRVQLIQEVCCALEHAHQRGVLHRDIKPQNIVLGPHGEVYLVDWGIAALHQHGGTQRGVSVDPDHHEAIQRSDEGALVGTPAYMAPERVLHGDDRPAGDTYALTAVLFELLTLHHPLEEALEHRGPLLASTDGTPAVAEDYVDPVQGRVPRPLSVICRKGLHKDPEQRYRTARDLEHALQAWVEGNFAIVCPGTFLQRVLHRWNRWIDQHPHLAPALSLGVFALNLALLLGGLLWILLRA